VRWHSRLRPCRTGLLLHYTLVLRGRPICPGAPCYTVRRLAYAQVPSRAAVRVARTCAVSELKSTGGPSPELPLRWEPLPESASSKSLADEGEDAARGVLRALPPGARSPCT